MTTQSVNVELAASNYLEGQFGKDVYDEAQLSVLCSALWDFAHAYHAEQEKDLKREVQYWKDQYESLASQLKHPRHGEGL